jgi:hypothetical protein
VLPSFRLFSERSFWPSCPIPSVILFRLIG